MAPRTASRAKAATRAPRARAGATPAPTAAPAAPAMERLLLPYQVRWVMDQSPMAIWRKSRRIGADWCEAFRAVYERMFLGRSLDMWYSSADESAATEYIRYVAMWAKAFGAAAEQVVGTEIIDGDAFRVMSVTLPEVGGRRPRISAMTSNPKTFRSKGGDVTLSEFAHHADQRAMWQAASPCVTWGGRLRVISSEFGEGEFARLVDGAARVAVGQAKPSDVPMTLHQTTIDDAIGEGLVERINAVSGQRFTREGFREDCRRRSADEAIWREEYLCIRSTAADSYFPYDLIRPLVSQAAPRPTDNVSEFLSAVAGAARESDGLVAGVDIGRKRDLFVIWVLARHGGLRRTAGVLAWQGRDFGAMAGAIQATLDLAIGRLRVGRMAIDATGMGMQLAEHFEGRERYRVEGVTYTSAVKGDLFTRLRRDAEERTLTLPDDEVVLGDIHSVRRQVTSAGHVRYDAERNERGHADYGNALALALYADEQRGHECYGLRSIGGEW